MRIQGTKHPSQRDVPPFRSRSSTCAGLAHWTRGRRPRPPTPGPWVCKSPPPHTVTSSVLLNALEITWGSCGSFSINSTDSNLKCGTLQVPMDYHDNSVGTARLAVIKYSATASKKLGTVFSNPGDSLRPPFMISHQHPIFTGGPGGSGLEFIAESGAEFSKASGGAFDMISWDPRGVGQTL